MHRVSRALDPKALTDPSIALAEPWLLLFHQLPAKPAYLRVKVWRLLQLLGAVAVKNAVYALPASTGAREDFEWLIKEIVAGGGDAFVCAARLLDGLSDAEVRGLFNAARDTAYAEIAVEARQVSGDLGPRPDQGAQTAAKGRLARLQARLAAQVAVDFFGANGREAADGLLSALAYSLTEDSAMADAEPTPAAGPMKLTGRVWVTRTDVHVDRIACAWAVRRFVDPNARFKFVPSREYDPAPGELRFDMFAAEITHEGDRCSFEVLLERAGLLKDRGLRAIGEIVHDIDLKDQKYGRTEAPGVAQLLAGVVAATADDAECLRRGGALFDDLYESFSRKRPRAARKPGS